MTQMSPFLVAQITDIHLFAEASQELLGLPTTYSFEAVIKQLKKLRPQPDMLLLTGDLSQDGTAESYQRVASFLNPLQIPTYWLPGNHDQPLVMEQVLNHPPISAQKSFEAGGWQFLLLNSHEPGCVHGRLSPLELNWLDQQLKLAGERPTLIALHHPPFRVSSDWLDTSTLQNPEDLFAVIDCYPQVEIVVFGHIHQEFDQSRRSVRYLGSPSTSIQFEPHSNKFSLDKRTPGFRLLNLYTDSTFKTQIQRVAYAHEMDLAATGY
jgi:Icc protein